MFNEKLRPDLLKKFNGSAFYLVNSQKIIIDIISTFKISFNGLQWLICKILLNSSINMIKFSIIRCLKHLWLVKLIALLKILAYINLYFQYKTTYN